ncbi:MAG: sigma-70 family RNA polymerase sigma factor [Caulobacter sp.]|nr:sigma-70 family RNA polymerase sigma factor [Caulobacter sp.]
MPRENPAQQQVETPDDGQINRLNARYRGPLTSYFLRRVRRRDEAEDLTQEVFLRMVRSLQRTDGDGGERIDNPEAFLFRTAVNLLRDRARRAKTFAEHLAEAAHRDENIDRDRDAVRRLVEFDREVHDQGAGASGKARSRVLEQVRGPILVRQHRSRRGRALADAAGRRPR